MTVFDSLNDPLPRTILGYLLAAVVATLAYKTRSLSSSGSIAAAIVGGSIVATGGWWLGFVLIVYFASSSLLSSVAEGRRGRPDQARGKQRDAIQVLANGGIPTALAVVGIFASPGTPWIVGSLAAIAGATADTWATEIGRWAGRTPRLITSGRLVSPGTSGGITISGSLGSLAGAVLIGLLAAIGPVPGLATNGPASLSIFIVVVLGGLAGSIADSLLGATVQEKRICPLCNESTETMRHQCGSLTVHASGWRGLNNDSVNLLSIVVAGAVGGLLSLAMITG